MAAMAAQRSQLFAEAQDAPQAVEAQLAGNRAASAALGQQLRRLAPRAVVTCARGSSDHAATYARYLVETRLGLLTSSASPSVSSVYAAQPDLAGTAFIAISQSGRSPDLLAATTAARAAGALVIALVNQESPLSRLAHHVLPLGAGTERSVAASKSYIASLAAIAGLVGHWSQDSALLSALDDVPRLLRSAWQLDWMAAVPVLAPASSLYVIGRGLGLTVAQEAALKLKETCGLHAEAFSAAEVRHGPMALARAGFPAFVFSQDDETRAGIDGFTRDFIAHGGTVLRAGGEGAASVRLPTLAAHPAIEPMLLIQGFYRMVNALAIARGLDPDRPPHLRKVTETL
jgi:glucosamine--fructose-6-phosphate aminotransferase (isomerizing)